MLAPRAQILRGALNGVALDEFRPDIEGLRALAVIAVLGFHSGIAGFRGGFVGVDVFFVVSGFLITRFLLRELATTGTISLPRFWARRARRLLPASCLVVVGTVVAAQWALPPLAQRSLATDAAAAGAFVINFVFAHRLGDYFGAQLGSTKPSPLLHYWSLAVEEQFYLVWPATMLVLSRRPRHYRRLAATAVVAIAVASLLASVWMTDTHPTWAFFLLPARMWELLAGAAVAFAGPAFRTVSPRLRTFTGWFGVLGIAVAVVTYDESMVFPGSATILPVLATVLVITAGGSGGATFGPSSLLRIAPLQWIGGRSYAIYLWHWPALVLAEQRWGPLSLPARLVVVALSVVLAAISLALVEDPVRHSAWLAARAKRGLALGGALCLVAIGAGWLAGRSVPALDGGVTAEAPVLAPAALGAPADSTVAPGATPTPVTLTSLEGADLATLITAEQQVLAQGLTVKAVPSNLRPKLDKVGDDRPDVYRDGCVAIGVDDALTPCHYGPTGGPKVILYGDSHAAQWTPPLQQIATAQGFELLVLAKGGCPTAAVTIPTATLQRTCPIWRDRAVRYIADQHPALVIVTSSAHYPQSDDEWLTAFDQTIGRIAPLTSRLVVLGDNPGAKDDPASCLSANLRNVAACTTTRAKAIVEGRVQAERTVAGRYHGEFVDTADWLCTSSACPVIIGDIMIFRDLNHLTTIASTWLRPIVQAAIFPAGHP